MALYKKYQQQVQFIVVDVDTPSGQEFAQAFKARFVPAIFYINSQGEIVQRAVGEMFVDDQGKSTEAITFETLEKHIKKITP